MNDTRRDAQSKTLRDVEESARLHNKIEDAQTERLLAEASALDAD